MAANFLTAVAIQQNNTVYLGDGVTPGQTTNNVPTPGSGGVIDGDYWAVPVTDGVFSGFNYTETYPTSTTKPDIQAFHVVRISSTQSTDTWWLLGTSTQYAIAAQTVECCGDSSPYGIMPTAVPAIAPCQVICTNGATPAVYTAVMSLPSLGTGKYYPFGYFNGVALTAASAAGYASKAALLTFLNANWLTGALTATWAVTADNLTLTNTLDSSTATGADVLCAAVVII